MNSATYLRQFTFVIAVALFSAAPLAAQMGGSGHMPGQPPQPTPGAPTYPGASTNTPDQNGQQNMADQSFVSKTMENDQDQIRLSQLAEEKSQSPDVKKYGQEMVKIHGQVDDQLKPAAQQLGVDEPKAPSKKEMKEFEKMQALSGQDFDSAYIEEMGREQRASLKEFHSEAQDSQNTSLKQAASQDEPVLTQHYQTLEKIAQDHNVDLDSKEKK